MDLSESGKHKKYGTQVSYVLADIYIEDIACLRTAFVQDTYDVGYSEKLSDMSFAMQQLIEKGAYQSWIFGPSRLDENGKVKESFLTCGTVMIFSLVTGLINR